MAPQGNGRPEKGKSLLCKLNDYVVIDLETTGLSPYYNEIIELAAIKVRNGEIIDSYQQLIHPKHEIDEFISKLTGVTNQMVSNSPVIKEALPDFIKFIGNDIVVGHNIASFDANFLYDNMLACAGIGFRNDFLDTLRVSKLIFPKLPKHNLSSLCNYCNISVDGVHRALSDCKKTHDLLQKMYEILPEEDLIKLYQNKRNLHKQYVLDARNISSSVEIEDIDKSNPLYGKKVVFTGKLERYTRKDAMQIRAYFRSAISAAEMIVHFSDLSSLMRLIYSRVSDFESPVA